MGTVASAPTHTSHTGRGLHVALWLVQLGLALMFGMSGVMKLTQPIAVLVESLGWPGALDPALVRFIGGAELAGAIGMILPAAIRIRPELTPLAAIGLSLIMILAMGFHIARGEFFMLPTNLILAGLAAFVAWGRFTSARIKPWRERRTATSQ